MNAPNRETAYFEILSSNQKMSLTKLRKFVPGLKMKRQEFFEMRFGRFSWQSEPCSRGKRLFRVSQRIEVALIKLTAPPRSYRPTSMPPNDPILLLID